MVFSPHPDDDVISMAGTIHKLKDQGHHVMICYMTSGSNAVHDHESTKYIYFLKDFLKYSQPSEEPKEVQKILDVLQVAEQNIKEKRLDEVKSLDNNVVRNLKGFIRSSEAKIAVETLGI